MDAPRPPNTIPPPPTEAGEPRFPYLVHDPTAPKAGDYETLVDPTTGQRFRISGVTLAILSGLGQQPVTDFSRLPLSVRMSGPRLDNKPLGPRSR
jgi:hypothetical protein